jgi:hypothetical protein
VLRIELRFDEHVVKYAAAIQIGPEVYLRDRIRAWKLSKLISATCHHK